MDRANVRALLAASFSAAVLCSCSDQPLDMRAPDWA